MGLDALFKEATVFEMKTVERHLTSKEDIRRPVHGALL